MLNTLRGFGMKRQFRQLTMPADIEHALRLQFLSRQEAVNVHEFTSFKQRNNSKQRQTAFNKIV
eukprot:692726-Amphidinium_carterae.1